MYVIAALRVLHLASLATRTGHRWASSIWQAVAHSVQAAVLGSMVAPSNLFRPLTA
ncbi:hypothetical protein AZ54_02345 [Xanthomonas oryzae pv. oryzae PXO86]|nr:hypothetical protein AZ54_02345 [Xanthomonas oryzae pv. oryzae PXO86]